jgi:hypothetical protein
MAADSKFPYQNSVTPLYDLNMDSTKNASDLCGSSSTNLTYNFPIEESVNPNKTVCISEG